MLTAFIRKNSGNGVQRENSDVNGVELEKYRQRRLTERRTAFNRKNSGNVNGVELGKTKNMALTAFNLKNSGINGV